MQRLPSAVLGIICIAVSMLIVWSVNPAGAGEQTAAKTEATAGQESAGGAAELSALLQDPLANISALMTDNTISFRTGPTNERAYEFNIQPVYSLNFQELGWTVIPRGMIPILGLKPGAELPRLANDGITVVDEGQKDRQWGLGDIVTQFFFTPMDQKGIKLGGGPMLSWKTRTNDDLKGPGWGAGLVGVMVGGGEVFSYAVVLGHLWGYDGDFSTSFTQPMLYYNFEFLPGAYIAYNNTISYDVKATGDFDDKWTIPLGLTAGKTFDMGGGHGFDLSLGSYVLPSWGRPKGAAEYQVKFGLTWIFPR
jgi:hypothetical protein